MQRQIFLGIVLLAALTSCNLQPSHGENTRAALISSYTELFRSLDKDHDGTLDRAEVGTLVDHFIALEGKSAPGRLSTSQLARQREQLMADIARKDKDHDGRLSLQDLLKEPLAMFDCMDRNHDGRLSSDELSSGTARCALLEQNRNAVRS